ncbi:HypC/HybG/HupF family hydrogenase formation chaperone [Streptosporangium sp. NPDC051023]|uniref:HypC/HybG/HupF family hydrogenase formation chaperone n=1 Tax=Streptosporangium sp. NPDC051023 TaxID=3155410 RepID=UPI00344B788A
MTGRERAGGNEVPIAGPCHEDVCVTCSDEAVPMRVVRLLEAGLAVVDTGRGTEEVSVALVDAQVGDIVLVHAREAIAVVKGVTT